MNIETRKWKFEIREWRCSGGFISPPSKNGGVKPPLRRYRESLLCSAGLQPGTGGFAALKGGATSSRQARRGEHQPAALGVVVLAKREPLAVEHRVPAVTIAHVVQPLVQIPAAIRAPVEHLVLPPVGFQIGD